jgi:glutamyl-Q tRNA(Asp) synthetase
MNASCYRGRFAPSPTGPLHFGSLTAALASWLDARHHQGQWLVRIEDIDRPREVPGAADAQLRTLAAFGLESDSPPVRQSERDALYQAALEHLQASDAVFACSCSRRELAASGGIHRRCLHPPTPPAALRLRVPAQQLAFDDRCVGRFTQNLRDEVGDFVLRRVDGLWSYQLAVVVDDAEQGITDVVRGADLLDSTPRQIHLQQRLGLPTPRYLHVPLVLDVDGRKLSKSNAALPVDAADPLPALDAAWAALGQRADALAGIAGRDAWLRAARAAFDPARIGVRPWWPHELAAAQRSVTGGV